MSVLKPHVAINVKNLDESVAFYRRLFGVEPAKMRPGYAKFDLVSPPLNFSLNEGPGSERGSLSHLGIQVSSTEDVLAFRKRWSQAGMPVREEMSTVCCYALQDKVWVRDPDGNEWEVFVVLKDDLPERTQPSSSCCAPNSLISTDTLRS
jgi:catechol 2,3-dioxygenase-like lactoylglutathione lyase family enzyme